MRTFREIRSLAEPNTSSEQKLHDSSRQAPLLGLCVILFFFSFVRVFQRPLLDRLPEPLVLLNDAVPPDFPMLNSNRIVARRMLLRLLR